MTQEEKAKAYDEALERARKMLNMILDNELLGFPDQIREIFPQLCDSESEDERIRKALIDLVCTVGEYYLPKLEVRNKMLDYLEKQKENPKSSDSIPVDCTSDTKCKDRWHKVTDSLPDNPREVLCKDEAGNYLISRYYGDKGWVLNYDYISPVSEWVDFPSEKQKEQKPSIFPPGLGEVRWNPLSSVRQKPINMEVYEAGKGTTICGQDYKCKKDYKAGNC